MLPIWPTSPVPANLTRQPIWGENVVTFDSGGRQASSPFVKPLVKYSVSLSNIPRSKQSSLWAFFNRSKGQTIPFLFMDPYDYQVQGALAVPVNAGVSSFFMLSNEGWPVIAASGQVTITSAQSGALTANSHWLLEQDTGIIQVLINSGRVNSADSWTCSGNYFRKCGFADQYQETSPIWNSFNAQVVWSELPLP